MAFYEPRNHHPASFSIEKDMQRRVIAKREWVTKQDAYNAYAAVVGNGLAWGSIALIAYFLAKPYINYMLGLDLL